MKKIYTIVAALLILGNISAQPYYKFRKPTAVNSTTWKFASVASGVDAIVTVIGSKNATLDKIDDSTQYAYAWNPAIKYTSTTTHSYDSSYVEFNVAFKKSSNNTLTSLQSKLAMTVIDCDGTLSFREMVKTSQPATSAGILGSLLGLVIDTKWLTTLGSLVDLGGIDTSGYLAMTQINYTNISSYNMKVGVLGKISGGTVRQASFYYKGFSAMSVPLAVELTKFNAELKSNNSELTWSTASEESLERFDVCRSTDGRNFFPVGSVNATVNSNEQINYNFTDYNVANANSPVVYYRLKMVNNDGTFKYSGISQIKVGGISNTPSVVVFPNPTTEFVNVTLAETTDINVSIVDAYGKTILTSSNPDLSNNNITFDVKNLENGIYFINIMNSDGTSTSSKFIKR